MWKKLGDAGLAALLHITKLQPFPEKKYPHTQ